PHTASVVLSRLTLLLKPGRFDGLVQVVHDCGLPLQHVMPAGVLGRTDERISGFKEGGSCAYAVGEHMLERAHLEKDGRTGCSPHRLLIEPGRAARVPRGEGRRPPQRW